MSIDEIDFLKYKTFDDFCKGYNLTKQEGFKLILEHIEIISKKIKEEEGGKNSQCNSRNSFSC